MRRFCDESGIEWTVAVHGASFGEVMLLFARAGSEQMFQSPFEVESIGDAHFLLAELADVDLRRRLDEAEPFEL